MCSISKFVSASSELYLKFLFSLHVSNPFSNKCPTLMRLRCGGRPLSTILSYILLGWAESRLIPRWVDQWALVAVLLRRSLEPLWGYIFSCPSGSSYSNCSSKSSYLNATESPFHNDEAHFSEAAYSDEVAEDGVVNKKGLKASDYPCGSSSRSKNLDSITLLTLLQLD